MLLIDGGCRVQPADSDTQTDTKTAWQPGRAGWVTHTAPNAADSYTDHLLGMALFIKTKAECNWLSEWPWQVC